MCVYTTNVVCVYVLMVMCVNRYFETFDAISDVDVKDRLKLISLISKCSSKEELGRFYISVSIYLS